MKTKRFTEAARAARREVLRAEIVDGVRLLGRRAAEERGAVDHGVDAAHGGRERVHVEQIALDELDARVAQLGGARRIAHERAHSIAALGKSFGESAADFSGRSGDEDLHRRNIDAAARRDWKNRTARAKLARSRARNQTRAMHASAGRPRSHRAARVNRVRRVRAVRVRLRPRRPCRSSIPRPEIQLVVRFGPSARGGLDVHAFGARRRVHRKVIRGGQRTVTARLQLGASDAVLGVPASAIAGRIVALEDLWGDAATRRLCARLGDARDTVDAAAILESAIAERVDDRG